MRWGRAVAGFVVVGFGLACAGIKPDDACCSVDDVLLMHREDVPTEVILDALHTSGTDLQLSAIDISDLNKAGLDPLVIDTLNGGPCICAEADLEPDLEEATARPRSTAPVPRADPEPVARLNLKIPYQSGRSFQVVNLSGQDYTNVVVRINGRYQYRLKKLAAGKADNMRFGNFVDSRTGTTLTNTRVTQISVRADQGTYVQRY